MRIKSMFFGLIAGGVLLLSLAACQTSVNMSPLQTQLATLSGHYVWNSQEKMYVYTNPSGLDEIAQAYDLETLLPQLVSCMDNATPTQSTLNHEAVPLGVLCYQAITLLVYHEEVNEGGDLLDWPGYIHLPASPADLKAAQEAWRKVISEKNYVVQ